MATLIGLLNPHSGKAANALSTQPRGASGWRLYCMFADVSGKTEADYMAGFRRYNLALKTVPPAKYVERAKRLITDDYIPKGEHVVLLGAVVKEAFEKALVTDFATEPFVGVSFAGRTWYYMPHPSGLTRAYNDPAVRRRAGLLLTKIYEGTND